LNERRAKPGQGGALTRREVPGFRGGGRDHPRRLQRAAQLPTSTAEHASRIEHVEALGVGREGTKQNGFGHVQAAFVKKAKQVRKGDRRDVQTAHQRCGALEDGLHPGSWDEGSIG
jgi:hypothetical protein